MKKRKGFTLLEMIVALFILTTGLIAVIGLSFRNVIQGRESLKQLQAANFAREGIEIVRNIRDSNKYNTTSTSGDKLWEGLKLAGKQIIDNTQFDNPTFTQDQILKLVGYTTDPDLQVFNEIWQKPDHFFVQGTFSFIPADSTETGFYRTINLYAMCENDHYERNPPRLTRITTPTTCNLSNGTERLIGIEVVSEVTWTEGQNAKKLVVEERLYNW